MRFLTAFFASKVKRPQHPFLFANQTLIATRKALVARSAAQVATHLTVVARSPTQVATHLTLVSRSPTQVATHSTLVARSPTQVATHSTLVATSPTEVARHLTLLATSPTEVARHSTLLATSPTEVASPKPHQHCYSMLFTPFTIIGVSWCMSKITISFFPFFRKGAGQYSCFCGPMFQYRPRLWPFTQTTPFSHWLTSR